MASDDTYEDEFQLVNEFENTNEDNKLIKSEKKKRMLIMMLQVMIMTIWM